MPDSYGMCYGSLRIAAVGTKNLISIGLMCCIWYVRAGSEDLNQAPSEHHRPSSTSAKAKGSPQHGQDHPLPSPVALGCCRGQDQLPPQPQRKGTVTMGTAGGDHMGQGQQGLARMLLRAQKASSQGRQPVQNLERTSQEGTLGQGGAGARGRSTGRAAEQSQTSTVTSRHRGTQKGTAQRDSHGTEQSSQGEIY